ncbi:ABC-type nitrate/sulfonate/bicarbonate transport system permease component [Ammoniphilus resinae]|uniref:ABC-type nitrate/sulfonate/bicarbonate transport system permease component n=2 Tax=Ammoniphilus resinae TaxID=861532 RepID=A0ABS4GN55_9BACL|nr:ABC-type nitrate/sulfonate/bicarbonate transport system permease component [Ammoniphilus resinae]
MKNWPNIDKSRLSGKGAKGWLSLALPGSLLIALLIIWEMAVHLSGIEKWLLPSPSLILKSLWETKDLILHHSLQTLYEALLGLVIAVLVGVLIAIMIDLSTRIRQAVYPLLVVSQTIPIIAVAPLLMIWFGYGMTTKILVVALVCFFPIAVNLADGFRLVDQEMIRLLASMGASKGQMFRMVKLPAALPFFFSGMRIAGTYSVMGAVIGEWLGASRGLGIFMTRSSQSFLTDRVFASILVIVFLSLIIFGLIEGMARWLMPWHRRSDFK